MLNNFHDEFIHAKDQLNIINNLCKIHVIYIIWKNVDREFIYYDHDLKIPLIFLSNIIGKILLNNYFIFILFQRGRLHPVVTGTI